MVLVGYIGAVHVSNDGREQLVFGERIIIDRKILCRQSPSVFDCYPVIDPLYRSPSRRVHCSDDC